MCSKTSASYGSSILFVAELSRKGRYDFQVLIVEFVNHFADYTLNGCEKIRNIVRVNKFDFAILIITRR